MKRMLQSIVCALLLGLFAAGCGGSNTPATGSKGDPSVRVQELVTKLNDKKAKIEARSGAAIALGRMGSEAESALPHLEKIASTDKNKKLQEQARTAIGRIKGE